MPKTLKPTYFVSFELQFTQDGATFLVKRDGTAIYSRSLGKFLLAGLVPSEPVEKIVEKIVEVEKEVVKIQRGYPNSIYWQNGKEFKSTAIQSFLYDASNQELAIRWIGNADTTYVYGNVPLSILTALLDSESIGRFVSNKVVSKFPVDQVETNEYSRRKLEEYIAATKDDQETLQYTPTPATSEQTIKDRSASAINALFPKGAGFPFN